MRNKLLSCIFLLFVACFFFAQMQSKEKVLYVGIESDIIYNNPWDMEFAVDAKILWNIFEPLVTLEENSTKVKPCLATSWYTNDNNRIWLLKLKKDVKFHDGSVLTADDVVAAASLFKDFNAKVEKVDDLIVRFTLPEPNSGFLNKLGVIKYAIAPVKTVRSYELLQKEKRLKDFIPVGTGPFKLAQHKKGKEIILDSFSYYWRGSPWLRKIIYKIIPNNKTRISALEKGEIDVIDVLFPEDLTRIKKNRNFKLSSMFGMNICYIAMNTAHKPFNNIMIRRAFNIAVDKLKLGRMFYYGGYGVPTERVLSPAFWGFSAIPKAGNYQPIKAKQILTSYGYNKDLALKLVIVPVARPYIPDPEGVAEEIKKQLADIGVKIIIIKPANYAEFLSLLNSGEYDMVLAGWIDLAGEPGHIFSYLLSSGQSPIYNQAQWSNKLFDERLKAAKELPYKDVNGRIKLYNEAQQIFQQELPWIPLFHTKIFIVHNSKVKGIIFYPNSMISYHKVTF